MANKKTWRETSIKLFGIITILVIIGFSMVACDDGNGGGGGTEPPPPPDIVNPPPPPANTGPSVSRVTITASLASMETGSTFTFTASVAGANDPAQTVNWSIVDAEKTKRGTQFGTGEQVGVLTVDPDETLTSLTIKASSAVDGTKVDEKTFDIKKVTNPNFFVFNSETGTISNYVGTSSSEIIIPSAIRGTPVRTLGDGTNSISMSTTNLVIPDSVTTIANNAFQSNYSIRSITIGDTGNSTVTIGDNAFYNSYYLVNVTIRSRVTTIGNNAFQGTQLTSLVLPNSVTTIGNNAFTGTYLDIVDIPNSVTTIGNNAFAGTKLTRVTIGTGVTTIGTGAFQSTQLATVTIPNNVTSIGAGAFAYINTLTSVTIGTGVITLGDNAFYASVSDSDNKLTSVTLNIVPTTTTSIGNSVFNGGVLTSIIMGAANVPIKSDTFSSNGFETLYLGTANRQAGTYTRTRTVTGDTVSFGTWARQS